MKEIYFVINPSYMVSLQEQTFLSLSINHCVKMFSKNQSTQFLQNENLQVG